MPTPCTICQGGRIHAASHSKILYDTCPSGGPFRDRWGHGRRIYIKVTGRDECLPHALESLRLEHPGASFQTFASEYEGGRFLTAMLVIVEIPP